MENIGSVFKGKNNVSKSAKVVNSYIENCTICENVEIYNSVVKNSIIKSSAVIGPFSHIRDGSLIEENVRVGNFVEIKNSKVGKNTKVAHMTYIGDAEVGENCNIGAGVVFCNYNGFEKQKIRLGDWVFVGSNSNLVAPLEIGDKAFIAAGTTVTRSIEEEKCVIGRVGQKEFEFNNPYLKKLPKPKWFGTDGIRGRWGESLNEGLVEEVARALCLSGAKTIVLGRDTRPSGQVVCQILKGVFKKYRTKVVDLGVVTTPCVAFATRQTNACYGVMVSASHNPAEFNGIKIFDGNGEKLSQKREIQLEKYFFNKKYFKILKNNKNKTKNKYFLINKYKNYIKNYFSNNLNNIKIIIDCANGGAGFCAKEVFEGLGAEVEVINIKGDINKNCGALYPQGLQKRVQDKNADLGFAFDGDADRVVCVLGTGEVLDGDDIVYVLARYFKNKGKIKKDVVVGTIMTNLGTEKKLASEGVLFERTDVGDKWIAKKLKAQDLFLGAEQAGHIILNDGYCQGDGILIARILAHIFKERTDLFEDALKGKTYQKKKDINLAVVSIDESKLENLVEGVNKSLGQCERIVARKSGTENKLRLMAESYEELKAEKLLLDLENRVFEEVACVKD